MFYTDKQNQIQYTTTNAFLNDKEYYCYLCKQKYNSNISPYPQQNIHSIIERVKIYCRQDSKQMNKTKY